MSVSIACSGCRKSDAFVEGKAGCSFCLTRYTEDELYAARQKLKQEEYCEKWRYRFVPAAGGFLLLNWLIKWITGVDISATVPGMGAFAAGMILLLAYGLLVAPRKAKKLFPEQKSA